LKFEIRDLKLGTRFLSTALILCMAYDVFCADEAKPQPGASSTIIFKNADMLHGEPVSVGSDGKLIWQHPDSKQPFTFLLKNVKELNLQSQEARKADEQETFAAVLTNGDILKGTVVSLDSSFLLFKTWYAGELKIDRRMIREMINVGSFKPVYRGPGNLAEWRIPRQNRDNLEDETASKVEFKNGSLIFSGYEAFAEKKDIKLPDMVRLDFDTTTNNEGVGILFFTDKQINLKEGGSLSSEIYRLSAYGVRVSRHELTAGKCRNNEWQSGGNGGPRDDDGRLRKLLNTSKKIKLTIYANRKTGSINVYVNGSPALNFIDQEKEFPKGNGMAFVMIDNSDEIPVELSNMKVGTWDGKLPLEGASSDTVEKDTLLFSNKDKTSGTLKGISKGMLQFVTEFASLNIPLERVSNIITSSENRRQAKREQNDIRAYFASEERITVNISEISGGKIRGRSENFGEAVINLDAFEKISFNIYDEDNVNEDDNNISK